MKKSIVLFQCVFIFCILFAQASDNITASEDTYLRAGSYADDNFESSTELYVKSSTNNDFVREALMKFDLSAYETITSAKIYIYAYAQVSMDVNVYSIDNDSWSENSVTWNNAPSFNTNLGSIALSTSYSWVELDITSTVINDFSVSDKTFSIGFKDDNGLKKTIRISSKENSAQYIPYLQVEGTLVGGGGDVAVTGVSVSPTNATININSTQQLSATINPGNATNQAVSWSSSNGSIASVNSAGFVTGIATGTTTVTVTTADGSFTSNSTITVNNTTEPARDVYLVIGQSNTAGRGVIEAIDMVALNGADLFNGSNWESATNTSDADGGPNRYSTIQKETADQGLNFAYTFGRKLNEDTGQQIGLVVNARGGTNINDWAKGASAGYYAAAISQINLALALPNTTIKGILWHQGESNRNDSSYLTKLSDLIADLRSDLGVSDLAFIAGQLSMEREDNATFNANLETLPSIVSNTDYAESDGLGTTDLTHFDSAAQRILGERYASKILQLVYSDANPSIVCVADINQTNDAGIEGAIVTYVAPVGTDNLPGSSTVQIAGLDSGALFPIGITTNTFVVTDSDGNTATCSFDVTVIDDEDPTIICLADISQSTDAGDDEAIVTYVAPVGTDNVTGAITVQTAGLVSGELFPIGTTTNTFEVTDAAGNTATCSFDVTITDDEDPSIVCLSDISQSNDAGEEGAIITYTTPEGTDNSTGETTVQTAGLASGELFPIGTTTNTFEVTDASGNTATCSFDVTVTDDEDPTITCLANISQSTDAGDDEAIVTYVTPEGADNSTGATTVQTAGLASGELFPLGITTNTFEVTDAVGNTATCSFDITITDDEDPTIICLSDIIQTEDSGMNGAIVTYVAPVGTDNATGVNTVQTAGLGSGALFPIGTTINTFLSTDAAGNTAACSFSVTITETDDVDPTIACLADISQSNDTGVDGAIVTYVAPIGTDNLAGATTVQTVGLASGSLFPLGSTTNTFVVTDVAGNSATCSFIVTITDDEDPTIVCLSNISQSNDIGVDGAIVNYIAPVGGDNAAGVTTVQTAGIASGGLFPIGITTNTFEATDAAGNTATCSFTVTITDDEDPTIICLSDINQSVDIGVNGAIVTYIAPTGTDNATGATTVQTSGLASGLLFPVGITTNTFETTDAAGNIATCSFTVTITDDVDPIIVCLSDINQSNDSGTDGAVVTYVAPVGTDNLTGANTVQTAGLASGSLFPIGTTTNTFVVTDAAGNTSTCSFTVTITDDEDPAIVCLADINQSNDVGQSGAFVNYTTPVGTDNSSSANTLQTTGLSSGSLFPIGTTINTFVVTDAAGNAATCSFSITVTDEEDPSIVCLSDINQTVGAGVNGDIVTYTTPVGSDNVSGASTVQTVGLSSGSLFPIGTTTNTFEVTDAAGNTDSCSFTVTITEEAETCNILIDEHNFDSSWGIWNDGGTDCRRNSNDASFANGGTGKCIRLRDNTSTSVATTDDLNLTAFTEITVDFNYIADQMENGEDFWLQISTDGGSSYQTVGDWDANDEFVNGTRYFESVTIQGAFSSNTRIRFRMDATANADLVYIDDVKITGCSSSGATSKETYVPKEEAISLNDDIEPEQTQIALVGYPNPFVNNFTLKAPVYEGQGPALVELVSISGRVLISKKIQNQSVIEMNDMRLSIGVYIVRVSYSNGKVLMKKMIRAD